MTSTYPFIIHPNQVVTSHGYDGMGVVPTNPNADGSLNQEGFIGAYSPESRRQRIQKFLEKRSRRVWTKKVKYDVRKNFADSRLRVKGRFVKKEDEEVLRDRIPVVSSVDETTVVITDENMAQQQQINSSSQPQEENEPIDHLEQQSIEAVGISDSMSLPN